MKTKTYVKNKIPKALREQLWLRYIGKIYEHKCYIPWCLNIIDVFNFHCAHNIPEINEGETSLENLRPICSRCNLSMGSQYTIDEWCKLGLDICNKDTVKVKKSFFGCFLGKYWCIW